MPEEHGQEDQGVVEIVDLVKPSPILTIKEYHDLPENFLEIYKEHLIKMEGKKPAIVDEIIKHLTTIFDAVAGKNVRHKGLEEIVEKICNTPAIQEAMAAAAEAAAAEAAAAEAAAADDVVDANDGNTEANAEINEENDDGDSEE